MKNAPRLAALAAVILLGACAPQPAPTRTPTAEEWAGVQRARAAIEAGQAQSLASASRTAQDATAEAICRQRAGVQATMVRGGVLYQIAAERQFAATCLDAYRRTGIMPTL